MDEQAIGGGTGESMGATAADKADNSGPLEKRILSKNWSVRAGAYDELTQLSKDAAHGCKADFMREHACQWKVYLKDSNPGALEKCLDCFNAFLNKVHASIMVEHQNGIINLLVEKCMGHAKPVIKEKSLECFLMLFEVTESIEDSIETLQALVKHKNIKVLTTATLAVASLFQNFSIKKFKIQDFAEQMLKNAMNTNPACKNAAYEYYKAVYKWIGDAILPQIEDKLKKQQIEDLKKVFEEVKAKNDKSKRVFRSEKAAEEEAKKNAAIDAAMAEETKEEEVIDPLAFAPEVDLHDKFNGEWLDATAAIKKWNEKKEKIDELINTCEKNKIKAGNFDGLIAFLKKELANSNINVATVAIKAAAALTKNLKKDFAAGVKGLINAVLLKFKEKRGIVLIEVKNFMDAALHATNMEEVKEGMIPCITNVAPGVKDGTIKFVEQAAQVTFIDVLQRVADELLPAMVKAIDDKDGTVRESALHCMGILKGRLGDSVMDKFLKNVNKQKMEKIDEAAKEIKPSKYDRPENWKPPAPKKPKAVKVEDDGDALMSFEDKPKRAPPKGIGVKPKKKAPVVEDEEMADEQIVQPKAAVKKPPPNIGKKPEPRAKPASSGPTKGPTAPVIQEEDLGSGLSKEEAIEKAEEYYNAGTIAKFAEAKWQAKKEGFDELCSQVQEMQPPPQMIEALAKFIKAKMKDWKESNINLQKGIVALFQSFATIDSASKRAIQCAMSFFTEKLGDVKLVNLIKPMLLDLSELVTPKFISNQVIKYAATAKAPKVLQEACNHLKDTIENFGGSGVPLKETIDYAKLATAHATPAVRQAAIGLFCELYKHVGDAIRSFMNDIKDSTMKLIDQELDKITQYKKGEFEKKRQVRGQAEEEQAPGPGGKKKKADDDDLLACLPREDISKKLNSKLMDQFKHKDWKIRKKAGDDVEAILRDAKMRIENNGLGDLMDAMKAGMKDPNKAVVKVFIILLGLLADALGPAIKMYTKKCFVPMVGNISDKQALVRNEVVGAMNKWAEAVGPEIIINNISQILSVENPEARTEIFRWILDHQDNIKEADTKAMVKPLVTCLTDKSKDIRLQCEKTINCVMPITGHQEFYASLKDMKQAVQQTLKPVLDKIKANCVTSTSAPKEEEQEVEKPVAKPKGSFQKKADEKKQRDASANRRKPAAAPAPARKKVVEEDEIVINPLKKDKRAQLDARNKYPLNEVKGDHVERLQGYCEQIFGLKFHDQLFAKSADFNKHIKCVEEFGKFIKSQPDELIEILDILFKWCNLRINDSSNTKLLLSVLDFFGNLINHFVETAYELQDFEAVVLIGTLCDRAGVNNKIILEKVRKLIKMCYDVYDLKLCYRIMIDAGVKSKNLKAVAENLDEIADYFQKNGIDACTKKDFALFITCADSPDKGVRENALKVFGEAYTSLGEDVWRMFPKDVPIKVKGLLEARFKQVAKKSGGLNRSMGPGANQRATEVAATPTPKGGKRMSMVVGAGGIQGLQFNKPKIKDDATETVTKKLDDFGLEEKPAVEEDVDMAAVFQGKKQMTNSPAGGREEDVEMENQEDDEATAFGTRKTNNPVSEQQAQPANQNAPMEQIQPKPQNSFMNQPMRDLDDVLDGAEKNLNVDPELREQIDFILDHIRQLKVGDLLKRVDSLVALNELISATSGQGQELSKEQENQQKALIRCCDELIEAFTHVMDDIFKYPVNDIPLRFTKYFITIVNKTCASKEIMKEVTQDKVNKLAEQLLTRLLIENLDKIGQNKEGELILKNLNSSMLRMLENCNHTYIFCVLFTLLKDKKDDASMPKLAGLIIKCLLKLSKIMDKLIDKLDLSKFLVAIHEYLVVIDHDNKSQNDDLGIRIVKTLVNEVVKLRKEAIWQSYSVIENHAQPDNHIKRWIQIILKSLPTHANSSMPTPQEAQPQSRLQENQPSGQSRMYIEFEIKKIVQDLKDPHKMDQGIEKLNKFTKQNPTYDYNKHLIKESAHFAQNVEKKLNAFRNGQSWKSTTGDSDSLGQPQDKGQNQQMSKMDMLKQKLSVVAKQNQDKLNSSLGGNENKMSAFESKMAKFNGQNNMRQSHAPGAMGNNLMSQRDAGSRMGTMAAAGGNGGNLNSSFSALNNSLSAKWAKINSGQKKIGGLTGRPGMAQSSQNLAQTVNYGAQQQNLNGSNNKFQSKMTGGGFASRMQNKQQPAETGQIGGGIPSPSKIGQGGTSRIGGGGGAPSGGISSNSFRARIQGFGNNNNASGGGQQKAAPTSQTAVPQSSGGQSATNQDLQKRLADMKAKLQGLKKN